MRAYPTLLILLLSGCSVWGHGRSSPSVAGCDPAANCQTGETDGTCSECSGNWFCSHGMCIHRCTPKHYKRFEDNLVTKCGARLQARADLRGCDHGETYSCDYRAGYEQAYVDVSLGASGDVPALPPAAYWKSCARSPEGHQRANDWFAGYAAGAPQAKAIYEPYNRVAASPFGANGYPEVNVYRGQR